MQTLSPYHIEQTDLHELYQALYFLHNVAATKLVDGAWLYGLISRWHEPSCHDLVRTYLEELGDGEPGTSPRKGWPPPGCLPGARDSGLVACLAASSRPEQSTPDSARPWPA